MLYRRFGYLQSRLLLDKQAELNELERRLDALDSEVASGPQPGDLTTRDLMEEDAAERKELMDEIEARFCEYGKNHVAGAPNHAFHSDVFQRL
jgi:hypothetical protein